MAIISHIVVTFVLSFEQTNPFTAIKVKFPYRILTVSTPKRKLTNHRQKCGSFESAITTSCGRLTMEANGKITKKVFGD